MKKLLLFAILQIAILSQAQTYQIGDIVYSPDNEPAVVFYVFDDGNHGWAVALRDLPSGSVFSNFEFPPYEEFPNADEAVPYFIKKAVINDTSVSGYQPYFENIDGWLTTKNHIDSALYFVENYDASMLPPRVFMPQGDTALNWFFPYLRQIPFSSGWYLPTAGQMRKLFAAEIYIERILLQHNSQWLKSRKNYMTSTATNDTMYITMMGSSGHMNPVLHRASSKVRPIRNFGYVWKEEKEKFFCCGDKVTELGCEFIAENDTIISKTFTSYQGFDSIIQMSIRVLCPQFSIGGDQLVCEGASATVNVIHENGDFRYKWMENFHPYQTIGNEQYFTLENVTARNNLLVEVSQYFEQTDSYCKKTDDVQIAPLDIDFSINGRNVVCYNSSVTLSVPNVSDGTGYIWRETSPDGNIVGNEEILTIENLTNETTYYLTVASNECTGTANITIAVAEPFNVNIQPVQPLCYGENINLQASTNSTGRITYSWYDADNNILSNTTNLLTNNLYNTTQFSFSAFKTDGINPNSVNVEVGDIITSNNIVVKANQWEEAETQNLTPQGIIYAKNSDSISVVSINEFSNVRWGASYTTNEFTATWQEALEKMNGKPLTEIIVNNINTVTDTNYNAALRTRSLGERWYLPALGELNVLLSASETPYFQQALNVTNSQTLGENKYYWSATEKDITNAWSKNVLGTNAQSKQNELYVRPITTFRYNELILFKNSTSCRANADILVEVAEQKINYVYDTITYGNVYAYRDSVANFNDIGDHNFEWTFHNFNDCDSIIYINVYVEPKTIIVTPNEGQNKICGFLDPILEYQLSEQIPGIAGQLSRNDGEIVGSYNFTLDNLITSDIYNLVLAENSPTFDIDPIIFPVETANSCGNFVWNNNTYTESGTYQYVTTNTDGCQVVNTLQLTITPQIDTTHIYQTACNYYNWTAENYGTTSYTNTGDYSLHYYSSNGCDSIVTLHLTINQTQQTDVYVNACNYYEYNGNMYYISGNYTIRLLASTGCDSIVNLHLNIAFPPEPPTCEITQNSSCNENGTGQIEITAPLGEEYSYSIDGVNFQEEPIFTNLDEGNYEVVVMIESCTNSSFVEINTILPTTPLVTATNNTNCNGNENGQIIVTQPLGSGYSYSIDGTNFQVEPVFSNLAEGDYVVTVENEGCIATSEVIQISTIPISQPTATSNPNTNCTESGNGQIVVTTPIGDNYSYSIDGINFQTETIFDNLNEGEYLLTVENEGCTNTNIVEITTTIQRPTINISETRTDICIGDNILLNANGSSEGENISYLWSGPNDFVSTQNQPEIVNASSAEQGIYSLVITDNSTNCNIQEEIQISVHDFPNVYITDEISGDEVILTANGATTYLWENNSTDEQIRLQLVNDTIWVIGYNEFNCPDTASIVIYLPVNVQNINSNQINIFPIPAKETIFVQGNNIIKIELFDYSGRLIMSKHCDSFITSINLLNVATGEYLLQIATIDTIEQRKIVIIK